MMNYHNITYPDQNNGDGLRVVLWVSGCSHHCVNCQNQQTWNPDSGVVFDDAAKQELFAALNHDYIRGITFSGGDPLYKNNIIEILNLCTEIKKQFPDKNIWLYTGYTLNEIFSDQQTTYDNLIRQEIVKLVDVIVDGEYIEKLRDITLKWRGSSNQRVIDMKKTIDTKKIVLHCD